MSRTESSGEWHPFNNSESGAGKIGIGLRGPTRSKTAPWPSTAICCWSRIPSENHSASVPFHGSHGWSAGSGRRFGQRDDPLNVFRESAPGGKQF